MKQTGNTWLHVVILTLVALLSSDARGGGDSGQSTVVEKRVQLDLCSAAIEMPIQSDDDTCCPAKDLIDSTGAVVPDTSNVVRLHLTSDRLTISGTSSHSYASVTVKLVGLNDHVVWQKKVQSDSKGNFHLARLDLRRLAGRGLKAGYYDLVGLSKDECGTALLRVY